jgi:hypothetical protein
MPHLFVPGIIVLLKRVLEVQALHHWHWSSISG